MPSGAVTGQEARMTYSWTSQAPGTQDPGQEAGLQLWTECRFTGVLVGHQVTGHWCQHLGGADGSLSVGLVLCAGAGAVAFEPCRATAAISPTSCVWWARDVGVVPWVIVLVRLGT